MLFKFHFTNALLLTTTICFFKKTSFFMGGGGGGGIRNVLFVRMQDSGNNTAHYTTVTCPEAPAVGDGNDGVMCSFTS